MRFLFKEPGSGICLLLDVDLLDGLSRSPESDKRSRLVMMRWMYVHEYFTLCRTLYKSSYFLSSGDGGLSSTRFFSLSLVPHHIFIESSFRGWEAENDIRMVPMRDVLCAKLASFLISI